MLPSHRIVDAEGGSVGGEGDKDDTGEDSGIDLIRREEDPVPSPWNSEES